MAEEAYKERLDESMTAENPTELIQFFPESLDRQLELMPIKDRWRMGPIAFELRGNRSQMGVTWKLEPGSSLHGEFEDERRRKWKYEIIEESAGGKLRRAGIRSLWLYGEKTNPLLFYGYTLEGEGGFIFTAGIPDVFGNSIHLVSGIGELAHRKAAIWMDQDRPPIVPEYNLDSFWGDKFRSREKGANKESAFIQSVLDRSAVEQWLMLSHLRQTDYGLRYLDVLGMFLPRTSDTFKTGLVWKGKPEGVVPGNSMITQIVRGLRKGLAMGEELFPIEADALLDIDLSPTTTFELLEGGAWTKSEMKTVAGLVLIIHNGKHWLTPIEELDLGLTKVLLGQRRSGKSMAGKLAIISGKLEAKRGESSIGGVIEATARELGEELVIKYNGRQAKLRDRKISSSPVFIPGGYVDRGTGKLYQVVTGVVIVADPENRLSFSWSDRGRVEFVSTEPPVLLPVARLQRKQDQLHPGVKLALSQALEVLNTLGPRAIRIQLVDYLDQVLQK